MPPPAPFATIVTSQSGSPTLAMARPNPSTSTALVKNPVNRTTVRDPRPMASICSTTSRA